MLCGVWLATTLGALGALDQYKSVPGADGDAPGRWPAGSRLTPPRELPVLLLFAHPRCPCTRATLGELARVLTEAPGRVRTQVLFFRPPGAGAADWPETDLWRSAARLPAVSVGWDDGGQEARRFGSETSGRALLYGAHGRLLFAGGLTAARGHAGDSDGHDAVVALLRGQRPERARAPVFGCALTGTDTGREAARCGDEPCTPQ